MTTIQVAGKKYNWELTPFAIITADEQGIDVLAAMQQLSAAGSTAKNMRITLILAWAGTIGAGETHTFTDFVRQISMGDMTEIAEHISAALINLNKGADEAAAGKPQAQKRQPSGK